MLYRIVVVAFWIAVAVGFSVEVKERVERKLALDFDSHSVEFNCSTDMECYRDCMDLINDADECEKGLMTNK